MCNQSFELSVELVMCYTSILYKGDTAFHEHITNIVTLYKMKNTKKKFKIEKRYVCYECKIFYGANCFKEDRAHFIFVTS